YEITAEGGGGGGQGSTPTQILFASAFDNSVYIVNMDGTGTPQVHSDNATNGTVIGLFADYQGGNLYVNGGNGGSIFVAPLDGCNSVDGCTTTEIANSDVSGNSFYTYVDAPNNRYFFTTGTGVWVANLDGTTPATLLVAREDFPYDIVTSENINVNPQGIDYDPETGILYVGARIQVSRSKGPSGGIWRINVDGDQSIELLYGGQEYDPDSVNDVEGVRGIQINPENNKIFWAQNNFGVASSVQLKGEIMAASLDGSTTPTILASVMDEESDYMPMDVLYDPSLDELYWSEFNFNDISRINKISAEGTTGTEVNVFTNDGVDGGYIRGLAFATEATAGGGGEVTITQTDESGYTSGDAFPVGTTIQEYTATDSNGNTAVCSFTVTVQDIIAPVITDCPSNITQVNDSGVCEAVVTWTEPTASDNCTSSADLIWERSHVPGDIFPVGTTTVTYTATDASGNTSSMCSFDIIVTNNLPENVNGIVTGNDPIQAGTEFSLAADFMDDNLVSANWFFSSDGNFTNEDTAEYSYEGTLSGTTVIDDFVFDSTQTGVYTVKIVVEDACGETAQVVLDDNYVVVYDSSGGFVTGGGYIESPPGALLGTTVGGKANFGLVAKYTTGNNNVTLNGNTNFKFKNGDFHFKSNLYEEMSLVISGERKATYRGSGSINGEEGYDFMVTVIDGDAPGAGPMDVDSFRIKIWTSGSPNDVIYDNELGIPENADSNTALGGGSIVIHKPRGNSNARTVNISDDNNKYGNMDLFNIISWPNPSNSYFNLSIKSHNLVDNINIKVYDVSGKQVLTDVFNPSTTYRITESLGSGIYFVRLQQANVTRMMRIVKY
ncbi:MAG: HYR domain-containing protein, partial [Bacteroidia bacterium]|nr:HYR domain-containing protein [Bacteroidia bacterium]